MGVREKDRMEGSQVRHQAAHLCASLEIHLVAGLREPVQKRTPQRAPPEGSRSRAPTRELPPVRGQFLGAGAYGSPELAAYHVGARKALGALEKPPDKDAPAGKGAERV